MKRLTLATALLLSPALAQVNVPATPTSTPAPATTPAPAGAVLNLAAPVGAAVEFRSSITSRSVISDVKVVALPGSQVSEADLNQIRRDLTTAATKTVQTTTLSGKAFVKLAARAADGTVTLVSTIVQNGADGTPITLRFTQDITPDGQGRNLKFDTDNALLKTIFQSLTTEKLMQLANQNGADFQGVYGRPLVIGEARSETLTLDAESLLSGMFNAIASEQNAEQLFQQVQSTPLTVTTTTTYQGLNAQGLHAFTQNSQYGDWTIRVEGKDPMPTVAAKLGKVEASGTQTYRRDGLPGPSTQSLKMPMTMTMTMQGVQITMTMTVEQTTTMQPR